MKKNSCLSLMYHNVHPEGASFSELSPSVTSYFITDHQFKKQIEKIASQANFVRLKAVRDALLSQNTASKLITNSKPSFHITFDDGWQGTVDCAGPILESHKAEATIFVTTGFIGKNHFLTEGQLSQLPDETFQIGAHGKTHRILDRLNDADLKEELSGPKKRLEDLCGTQIETIACPGGGYSPKVRDFALEAGYEMIFTSRVDYISKQTLPVDVPRLAILSTTQDDQFDRYLKNDISQLIWRARVLSIPKRLLGNKLYNLIRSKLLGESKNQMEMTDLS